MNHCFTLIFVGWRAFQFASSTFDSTKPKGSVIYFSNSSEQFTTRHSHQHIHYVVAVNNNKQHNIASLGGNPSSSYSFPHLRQDVSSAWSPVHARLAEPPLLLLHDQRLRPARSSGKLHLKIGRTSIFSSLSFVSRISVSTVSTFCQTLSRLHLSAVRLMPIGGCTALGPPRSAGLERSGQTREAILDNSISATTPLVVPVSNDSPYESSFCTNHMQQQQQ